MIELIIEVFLEALIIFAPDKVVLWAAGFIVFITGIFVAMACLVLVLHP